MKNVSDIFFLFIETFRVSRRLIKENLPYRFNYTFKLQLMKAKKNLKAQQEDMRSFISHINWDWWFFKGQLIIGSILLFAVVIFILWS